jgi:hypothetical protein
VFVRFSAAAAGGARAAPQGDAGAVPRQGGALRVRVPGQERRRRARRQRGAQPGRDALHPGVEQHAVRDQRGVPPLRLLRLPLLRRVVPTSLLRRCVRVRLRGRGVRVRPVAGGLRAGQQPARDELPGRVRRAVPGAGAPPRRVHRAVQAQQGVHRVRAGVRRLVPAQGSQPQRRGRRRRRRARPPRPVQGPPRQLHADGGVHVQHRAHGRHVRHAQPAGPERGGAAPGFSNRDRPARRRTKVYVNR